MKIMVKTDYIAQNNYVDTYVSASSRHIFNFTKIKEEAIIGNPYAIIT